MNSLRTNLRVVSERLNLEPATLPSMAINAVIGSAINTSAAMILCGTSLGTAIVTVGLPAGAVAALAVLLSSLFQKVLDKNGFTDFSYQEVRNPLLHYTTPPVGCIDNSTIKIEYLALKNVATTLCIGALGLLSPVFRINILFSLAMHQIGIASMAINGMREMPRSQILSWDSGVLFMASALRA